MANECSAMELFTDLQRDFGEEAMEGAAILHWTTAEYDSPVDDVLTADMHVALRSDNHVVIEQNHKYLVYNI